MTTTQLTADGGWCWFSDPRAVYYNGKTYFGYTAGNSAGRVYACCYDHATKTVSVAFDLYGAFFENDDHDNPVFLIRHSDHKILAFYNLHVGDHYSRLSSDPEDTTSWGAAVNITAQTGALTPTYVNPIQLIGEADDPIYLFFRECDAGGCARQSMSYSKSINEGGSWATRIKVAHITYHKVAQNRMDRIDFCLSEHPVEERDHGIYHMYYQGGNFYKSDGTVITADKPYECTDLTQVYDGTDVMGWIWDIAIEPVTKYPVIVYATFPATTNHRYSYARWTGAAWDKHEICAGGTHICDVGAGVEYYSGGVYLDHNDPSVVYVSQQVGSQWEIFRYQTADGGATWSNVAITTSSDKQQLRPITVRDYANDLQALWLSGTYTTYTDWDVDILGWGATGAKVLHVLTSQGKALKHGATLLIG